MSRPRVHVLNGPNLSRLGRREPEVYGTTTLAELAALCGGWADGLGLDLVFEQCEGEGELVALIHRAGDQAAGLILNAAAYTHTSVAVRDAVCAIAIPVVEVHLSNPAAREPFRRRNLLEDVVYAGVRGFGTEGYRLALEGLAARLRD
ncbi:MAG: 3-dehydroquinate dehydratase [bacterium]|nr:3-dehydroquinate dehydratase [bacterium]